MFTGLIESICTVRSARAGAKAMLLTVDLGDLAQDAKIGDSIAVNGVCLTIAKLDGAVATFDVSTETLAKSALGRLRASSQVNVERAIKPADRFGGHFVQGHTDGVATIKAIERHGEFVDIEFAAGPELLDQMVEKGSVAVDGISLTIAGLDESTFTVALIPRTLKETTLGAGKIGDLVNIETDIIVKTVKKQLEKILPHSHPLTAERLRELGF
jgi:riboflavin synthase